LYDKRERERKKKEEKKYNYTHSKKFTAKITRYRKVTQEKSQKLIQIHTAHKSNLINLNRIKLRKRNGTSVL